MEFFRCFILFEAQRLYTLDISSTIKIKKCHFKGEQVKYIVVIATSVSLDLVSRLHETDFVTIKGAYHNNFLMFKVFLLASFGKL